jgi:hypothetical protein
MRSIHLHLVDLGPISNGAGANAYGGRIEAFSFTRQDPLVWFDEFAQLTLSLIGKSYFPVYRIADGEMRFLFGERVNFQNQAARSIIRYVRCRLLRMQWQTSWGEIYSRKELIAAKETLLSCMRTIGSFGKLAVYWNLNAINAFTEYNTTILKSFDRIGIPLTNENYIPFHFGQALVCNRFPDLINGRKIGFVTSIKESEQEALKTRLLRAGAESVQFAECSGTGALMASYTRENFDDLPDIVMVAAGIGSARVLADLKVLGRPIIDIGGLIHVLSGKTPECHAGFFRSPFEAVK